MKKSKSKICICSSFQTIKGNPNKRGQIFLISAVILISILVGFFTIINYSKKTDSSRINSLSEQIQIESEKVMDYDLSQSANKTENFTNETSNKLDEDTRIYFITNTSSNNGLECYNYTGGKKNISSCKINIGGNKIIATIDQTNYTFPFYGQGKAFYYVMIKEYKGEKYVYTN